MHSIPREFRIHSIQSGRPISAFAAALLLLLAGAAQAQLVIPGNNGQDGAFAPNTNVQVDLSLAVTGEWDTTNSTGQGVYDPEQWAVIFRYTSVNIPSNVTVTFKNHPSRAPVIWLVQGNATIAGTVSLNGAKGHGGAPTSATFAEPGPGGFRGGRGTRTGALGSAGMGPGGGAYPSTGDYPGSGSYASIGASGSATPGSVYGNDGVFPLVGGSGGAGRRVIDCGGGGGGGAILIAVAEDIYVTGQIHANGGGAGNVNNSVTGGGSGGAIRLVADRVDGTGGLTADGGAFGGGAGRIRVEANTITLTAGHVNSTGLPTIPPRIFREPGDGVPTIKSMALNGQVVPDDPASYPTQDVALIGVDDLETVPMVITAEHVPSGSVVKARVVRLSGVEDIITAVFNGESGDESTWNADIPVAGGFSTIQVHAVLP
ncbi:MAG: hypothetical protein JNK74_28060 [Candidatus Hydrogenedentes bacterium]|nr:hypothetical protein [Candidatus Hydrogenedentota bacterium]